MVRDWGWLRKEDTDGGLAQYLLEAGERLSCVFGGQCIASVERRPFQVVILIMDE